MKNDYLWYYDIVSVIDEQSTLIRNKYNNQLMIKKDSSPECYEVLKIIQNIQNINLMKIYDVRLHNNICISICEYISGYTLDYLVEHKGPMKEKEAKEIVSAVCCGLSALHKNNIIHKDIKPSNVMISSDNIVKIIDFDISRTYKSGKNKDTTTLGTIGYASPEHFGFSQSDEKTDIYSCGVLLNYLLTGSEPDLCLYPGVLRYIILKCIEIDKEKRFRNAYELSLALKGKIKVSKGDFLPLPGFRGRHIIPKILMTLLIIAYFFLMFSYIYMYATNNPGIANWSMKMIYYNFIIVFICFTGAPYILFGDVGKLSEKINPRNPKNGIYVLRVFGILFIILGIILMFLEIK